MSPTQKRWLQVLLAPFIILLTMEMLLQLGSIIVATGTRDMPRNWLSDNTRLLAIGDSNTFGLYLAPEEAYPAQLESRWNSRFPKNSIEVLNLAYPGMNSFRILDNIDTMMDKFRPDAVLLTIGVNDYFAPVEQIADEGDTAFAHLVRGVARYSRLYHLIHMVRQSRNELSEVEIEGRKIVWNDDRDKRMEKMIDFKQANEGREGHEVMNAAGEEFVVIKKGEAASNIKHLKTNLAKIDAIVGGYGADLYLLTYGASKSLYAHSNQVTRDYANENPVKFIDAATELQRTCPDSEECPALFFEDLHPNARGYGFISIAVMERLARDWSLVD